MWTLPFFLSFSQHDSEGPTLTPRWALAAATPVRRLACPQCSCRAFCQDFFSLRIEIFKLKNCHFFITTNRTRSPPLYHGPLGARTRRWAMAAKEREQKLRNWYSHRLFWLLEVVCTSHLDGFNPNITFAGKCFKTSSQQFSNDYAVRCLQCLKVQNDFPEAERGTKLTAKTNHSNLPMNSSISLWDCCVFCDHKRNRVPLLCRFGWYRAVCYFWCGPISWKTRYHPRTRVHNSSGRNPPNHTAVWLKYHPPNH